MNFDGTTDVSGVVCTGQMFLQRYKMLPCSAEWRINDIKMDQILNWFQNDDVNSQ